MTSAGPATRALLAWVARDRPAVQGSLPDLARAICEVCVRELDVDGAAMSLMPSSAARETLWATDATADVLEELQFSLNEGLCIQAATSGRPVLVPDLGNGPELARWPVFAAEVLARTRARALFALPLQWGVTNLGVLDLYRYTSGGLSRAQWQDALAVTEIGGLLMLGIHTRPDPEAGDGLDNGNGLGPPAWTELFQGNHAVVHQATGMVLTQLGVSSTDALARLRAHAYSHSQLLIEVARDVVDHKLHFNENTGDTATGHHTKTVEDRDDGGTKR